MGPNGAGKSTVLSALNVFFLEQASSPTPTGRLIDEDYFLKRTTEPVRITVTFGDLSEYALGELADYVRQDALVVTAEAVYDGASGAGSVRHFGQRLGMEAFRSFFEARKAAAKAEELKRLYLELQACFPDLPNATSTEARATALQDYEATHCEECALIESEDTFYGVGGKGKLARHVQWVFVPAVKDASEEGQESKEQRVRKAHCQSCRSARGL